MKAVVVREHGGYGALRHEEVPDPGVEAPDDVVVRVEACALNRLDLFARRGLSGPGVRGPELPHVSGVDVAGTVAEAGPAATDLRPGDRVVIYPGLYCGECDECRRGEETMCRHYRIFGEHTWGGLAERARIRAANVVPLPDSLSFVGAAALGVAWTTAYRMVVTVGELRPTDRVLVLGASGGVGSAAVLLARRVGARVIGVTSGPEKCDALRELGADRAVDRTEEDFEEAVRRETEGRGVEMVVNPVGGTTWRPSIRSLAMGGRMVICGATIGDDPEVSIREIYQSHRRILGAPMGNRRDFAAVLDLARRGEIEPVIHGVLPLREIAEAHRQLEAGEAFGKVVMRP